jgi:predicted RNA binding protein YcfA (HicA-like mRNA interferase family)
MKMPRDISGKELEKKLEKYGYHATRQVGSHIRLTSTLKGPQHHVTVPAHIFLKVGTINAILDSVAGYLEIDKEALVEELFQT